MSKGRKIFFSVAAVSFLVLVVVGGCMTLPDVRTDQAVHHDAHVEFEGSGGPVTTRRGRGIMRGLQRSGTERHMLERHMAYEQSVNIDSPLVLGNSVLVLENGPVTYAAMLEAISTATDHINLETYIFGGDEVGQQFADALIERARAGVQVNVIYDSVGSLLTPAAFFDRLRENGIAVVAFNPINPFERSGRDWRINNRDHRRQLVIDGHIAFTGGVNISDTYLSSPSRRPSQGQRDRSGGDDSGWRDTHIRIEGPVVAEFQRLFLETWSHQADAPIEPRDYFPDLGYKGDEIIRVIGSRSAEDFSPIYLTLMSALTHAETNIYMTIAYFAPDSQLMDELLAATARGVEVVLVLPSHSDLWAIFHLGRAHYTKLLKGGVRIFERHGGLMHAKSVTIDGVWSTIGSSNMDWRSFLHNDELNAVILSHTFAERMETMFTDDLSESEEIVLREWRRRPIINHIQERLARIGAYWL